MKMMGRDKEGVDAAMAGFISMLEDEKEHVPALLGMSLAFTLEDSPNKVLLPMPHLPTIIADPKCHRHGPEGSCAGVLVDGI